MTGPTNKLKLLRVETTNSKSRFPAERLLGEQQRFSESDAWRQAELRSRLKTTPRRARSGMFACCINVLSIKKGKKNTKQMKRETSQELPRKTLAGEANQRRSRVQTDSGEHPGESVIHVRDEAPTLKTQSKHLLGRFSSCIQRRRYRRIHRRPAEASLSEVTEQRGSERGK